MKSPVQSLSSFSPPAFKAREVGRLPARAGGRVVTALLIGGAHLGIALLLMSERVPLDPRRPAVEPFIVEIIEPQRPVLDGLSLDPEELVQRKELAVPELPAQALLVEAAVDPPKIDPGFAPDMAIYSEQARLAVGRKAVVMLVLDISADGSVITAQLVRSSGDAAVNAAALEYARATRWIPGTVDGMPRVMQASLTVVLGESA